MTIRVINMTNYLIELSEPIGKRLPPRETRIYDWVLYDDTVNTSSIAHLLAQDKIRIDNLDGGVTGDYVAQWNLEPKLRLLPYVFWVDALGFFRMKSSNPTFDLDGVVIGPGAGGPVPPHGPTHVFTGTDPVPQIEVLEGAWNCTVAESVLDAVFESVAGTVRKANASSTVKMPCVGVIVNKPTPTTCIIARSGEVTGFVGLTVDVPYFVGLTDGTIATTIPTGAGRVAQRVGYSKTSTTLVIELGTPTRRV